MRRTLGALAFGAAAVLFLLTLAGYAGRWGPALEAIANFRLHLAVLAGVLGMVLGLARLRRSAGLAMLTTLIAAAGLGPFFDPAERPGEGQPLTLLYANLWDRNPQPDALAAMLRAIDADILITSETTRVVAEGAGGLRAAYPYRLVSSGPGEALRTAIWSKYPLSDSVLYLNNTVAPTGAAAQPGEAQDHAQRARQHRQMQAEVGDDLKGGVPATGISCHRQEKEQGRRA